VNELNEPQTVE